MFFFPLSGHLPSARPFLIGPFILLPTGTGQAKRNSRSAQVFAGSFLSDDQQSQVRDEVKEDKDDFEKAQERIDGHVEGFAGDVKPFAVHTVGLAD